MADTTIVASEDTYLDQESPGATDRHTIDNIQYRSSGTSVSRRNPIFRFDISSLQNQAWTSTKLILTYSDISSSYNPPDGATIYLSYVLKDVVITETNWTTVKTTGGTVLWATAGGMTSADNDYGTRVAWKINSLDDNSVTSDSHPQLLFSNVTTPIDTSPAPVLQSTPGVTTVSDRPPVSEPDRNVTVAIRHDGPEPMTILALVKRINYGEDA
jgi:hypothetical protein